MEPRDSVSDESTGSATPLPVPATRLTELEDSAPAPKENLRPTQVALLAGHAQGDFPEHSQKSCKSEVAQAKPAARRPPPTDDDDDEGSDEEDEDTFKKRYYACEAKLRRICEPKGVSGKVEADGPLVQQWKAKGHTRTQLVKLMMEAEGVKEQSSI